MNQLIQDIVLDINNIDMSDICRRIELLEYEYEMEVYKNIEEKYGKARRNEIEKNVQELKNKKTDLYFSELYYCLYKRKNIDICLYTIIASSIRNGIGHIKDNTFHIESIFFPRNISRILNTIKIDKPNSLSFDQIDEIMKYFLLLLLRKGFIRRMPIIGIVYDKKFIQLIRQNKPYKLIEDYINKNEIYLLGNIDSNIPLVKFTLSPSKKFKSFFRDEMDALSAYQEIRHGYHRDYYSVTGQKYPVE